MKLFFRYLRRFPWVLFLFVFIFLATIGALGHPLWGDEAETAVFGRNVLQFGYPKGWDGVNLMAYHNGVYLNHDLINYKSPWLQYYLAALSFVFFPQTTFSARLPFLLIGFFILPAFYYLSLRILQKKSMAIVSTAFVSVCIPFILFVYQTRYYSTIILMSLLFTYASFRLHEKNIWPKILFVVSGIVFFYANYAPFLSFAFSLFFTTAIVTRYFITQKDEQENMVKRLRMFLLLCIPIAIFTLPWIVILAPFHTLSEVPNVSAGGYLVRIFSYFLERLFIYNDNGIFPLVFLFAWLFLLIRTKRRGENASAIFFVGFLPLFFTFLMAVMTGIFHAETFFTSTRYTMVSFPFFVLTVSVVIFTIYRWRKDVAIIVAIIYGLTSGFSLSSFRILPLEYISEMLHPYPTPDTFVADYLNKHAKNGQTIFVSLDRDHEPLIFYLKKKLHFVKRLSRNNPLRFGKSGHIIPEDMYRVATPPDWVILYGKNGPDGSFQTFDFRTIPLVVNLGRDYTETVIPIFFSDETRPEIENRSFTYIPPSPSDMVYVYKKKF